MAPCWRIFLWSMKGNKDSATFALSTCLAPLPWLLWVHLRISPQESGPPIVLPDPCSLNQSILTKAFGVQDGYNAE